MKSIFNVIIALCFCTCFVTCNLFGRKQRVMVKGKLMCGNKPASNILVKLVDEDDGGIDDLMDTKSTDANGEFLLDGVESELSPVDPVLQIYHDCNDGLPCQRKWKIKIPNMHINTNKPADVGVYNLEMILVGESRDCIHKK